MKKHTILGGKVHIYQRPGSRQKWQCSTYLNGKNHRASTKEESLSAAKDFAEDWYLELRGKHRRGELHNEKTFSVAAKQFQKEYEVITDGQRSPKWVEGHKARLRLHLVPFFGNMPLSQVTAGQLQEYRVHRNENSITGKGFTAVTRRLDSTFLKPAPIGRLIATASVQGKSARDAEVVAELATQDRLIVARATAYLRIVQRP